MLPAMMWFIALIRQRLRVWLVEVSGREMLAYAGLAVLIGGLVIASSKAWDGACPGERLREQLKLDDSDREIRSLSTASDQARCNVYRRRRGLIDEGLQVARRCGTSRDTQAWLTTNELERNFFDHLIEEKCINQGIAVE